MRIGIDVSTWVNGRGFGRFTRELVSALVKVGADHEWVLFSDREDVGYPALPNVQIVTVPQRRPVTEAAVASGRRRIVDMLAFTSAVKREALDVLFYPAVYSWFPAPVGLPVVLTIHDAIAEHFPALVFPGRLNRFFWWAKMRLANAQATRILTVSKAAKAEIVEHLRFSAEKIDVTTEGPNAIFKPIEDRDKQTRLRQEICQRYDMPKDGRYFVYVGGFAPHKNLLRLVDALEQLKKTVDDTNAHLILVGDYEGHGFHSNHVELQDRIEASPILSQSVRFTGFISDSELAGIYATALAMVFPSLSEGFGLPAVESMAAGTPVLASNRASLPEVVGDAGLLFDPTSVDSIVESMHSFLIDRELRHELRVRSLTRVRKFSWEIAAEKTLESIISSVSG